MAGQNKITVEVDGKVIGMRRTPRSYAAAIVLTGTDGRLTVGSYHRDAALAHKALGGYRLAPGVSGRVLPTTVTPIAQRVRVRCAGLLIERAVGAPGSYAEAWTKGEIPAGLVATGYARAVRCLKDATNGERCPEHVATDNAAVEAEAAAARAEYTRLQNEKWAAKHAAEFTAATCPVRHGRCLIHGER